MSLKSSHHEERLAEAVSAYVDCLSRSSAPSVEEFLKGYPELADELEPLLRTCANMIDAAVDAHPLFDADAAFSKVQDALAAEKRRTAARTAVEGGRGGVQISQRPDFLLLLLLSAGEVWGITKLTKLLFLLGKETRARVAVPDFFNHVAYDFGPFDDAIYRDLEGLEGAGLLEARRPRSSSPSEKAVDAVYRLTARGRKFAEALARGANATHPGVVEEVEEVARKYAPLPLRKLLQHVYRAYPDYTTKSKIRDEVLGDDDNDSES